MVSSELSRAVMPECFGYGKLSTDVPEVSMDWDEVQKKPVKATTLGESLETLSVAELAQRIEELKKEIVRVEAELSKKRAHEAAASALFKR